MTTSEATRRCVISVLVPDRTGIVRDITSALADMGANIDQIRETVVEGYFTVTFTVTFDAPQERAAVHRAIAGRFPDDTASIMVRPFVAVTPPSAMPGGQRYVVTLTGTDRPGILKHLATYLADRGVNIEDWECHFEGPVVTYVGALTVPPQCAVRQLRDELRATMAALEFRATLQHENIFRATTEIGPIRGLLKDGHA